LPLLRCESYTVISWNLGRVAEWSIAAVSKTVEPLPVPEVRILSLPPFVLVTAYGLVDCLRDIARVAACSLTRTSRNQTGLRVTGIRSMTVAAPLNLLRSRSRRAAGSKTQRVVRSKPQPSQSTLVPQRRQPGSTNLRLRRPCRQYSAPFLRLRFAKRSSASGG
jgi:hypothetical protein